MKKLIITLAVLCILFVSPISIYAGPTADNEESVMAEETVSDEFEEYDNEVSYVDFSITDGIDSFKKTESTFDDSRTISGVAEKDTIIEIKVETLNSKGKVKETTTYEIIVGASGIFSQTIDLDMGENVINIIASKDDCQSIEEEATIKRKETAIKDELESSIIIPGNESIKTSPYFPPVLK